MAQKTATTLQPAGSGAGRPLDYAATIALSDAPKESIEKLKEEQQKLNPGTVWVKS